MTTVEQKPAGTTWPAVYEVPPARGPIRARVTVPGSKSITNRALVLAARWPGWCRVRGALWAEDTEVMVESLRRLGFAVRVMPEADEPANRTIEVEGRGGEIPASRAELYVGNAGTAARFLTALVCRGHGEYRIYGDARMHERPMGELFRALGIEGERLPVTIRARGMKPGRFVIRGEESSQFASALLLAGHEVETEPHPYVEMTRRMLREFGPEYEVEPDLSSASYFEAAGWVTGGAVEIARRPVESLQVDGRFRDFLGALGAEGPPLRVSRARELGDSAMTLAVCAVFGRRVLELVEAGRMRLQECDRLRALATELGRIGARVEERADELVVWPTDAGQLRGAEIETYRDHRMAMCFAVVGLKIPGVRLREPACVRKTFPNFFEKWEAMLQ
ncbi:MAG: 3-phosphoshikimate 1-carboxyvinyltransferase [Verrucomicrobiae bacterium]|nr:3-phosphoshikimate 1-carboxyvinyltransferase [Verrucomicrobiae bacterium]